MVIQTAPKPAAKAKTRTQHAAEIALKPKKPAPEVDVEPKRRGRAPSGQVIVTFRMDPEVRDKLQAEGPGWGARANSILKQALGL